MTPSRLIPVLVTGVLACSSVMRAQVVRFVDASVTGPGTGSQPDPYKDLQDAIDDSPDEIHVAAGTYKPTDKHGGTNDEHRTFVLDDISLKGGWDGTTTVPVVHNPSNVTTLSGAPVNGKSAYHVVTYTSGATDGLLSLVRVVDGEADRSVTPFTSRDRLGAGIICEGGSISIGGQFTGNYALDGGGAIFVDGGAEIVVSNSTFELNEAEFGFGGAIWARESDTTVTLFDCDIEQNTGTGGGTACTHGATLTAWHTSYLQNEALQNGSPWWGGAHYAHTWDDFNFNNASTESVFIRCTFDGNTAASGGAIFSNGSGGEVSTVRIANCGFYGNDATVFDGGAHYAGGSAVTMTNSLYYLNSAERHGGAFSTAGGDEGAAAAFEATNCTFRGNQVTAGGDGGALYLGGGGQVWNCAIGDNTVGFTLDQIYSGGTLDIDYTCTESETWSGTGNLNGDCGFDPSVPARLTSSSICLEAGNNSFAPVDVYDVDEDGFDTDVAPDFEIQTRIVGTVEMGAWEDPEERAGAPLYADCDRSASLGIFDFLCFQDAFVAMDPYADCDGSTVFDIFDFLCFQDAFTTGCP